MSKERYVRENSVHVSCINHTPLASRRGHAIEPALVDRNISSGEILMESFEKYEEYEEYEEVTLCRQTEKGRLDANVN